MFLHLLKSDMELSSVNAFSALLANRIGTIDYFPNELFNATTITSLFCAFAAAAFTYGYGKLRAYIISLLPQEREAAHESQGLLEGAR